MLPQGDSYVLKRAREDSLISALQSKVNFSQFNCLTDFKSLSVSGLPAVYTQHGTRMRGHTVS